MVAVLPLTFTVINLSLGPRGGARVSTSLGTSFKYRGGRTVSDIVDDVDRHEDKVFVEKGNSPVRMSDCFLVEGGPVG